MKSTCCNQKLISYNAESNLTFCSKCLSVVEVKKKNYNLFIAYFLFIFLLLVSVEVFAPPHIKRIIEKQKEKKEEFVLNDSTLLNYMNEIKILFPEIVLRQIHLESGHFKSSICKENKNLLGIKYIKQKEAIGENRGHAVYPDYKACLRDYKRLQKYYIKNLVGKYAEDPSYGKKLESK